MKTSKRKRKGSPAATAPTAIDQTEVQWREYPVVPALHGLDWDDHLEVLRVRLPTPWADDILHAQVLGEIAEDLLGLSPQLVKRFVSPLKFALERYLRTSRRLTATLGRPARKAVERLRRLRSRTDAILRELQGLRSAAFDAKNSEEGPLDSSLLALDLLEYHGRQVWRVEWLLDIENHLNRLRSAADFGLSIAPHGNENLAFHNFVTDLELAFASVGLPATKPTSFQPTDVFLSAVEEIFHATSIWGSAYVSGPGGMRSSDSLRTLVARAFEAHDQRYVKLGCTPPFHTRRRSKTSARRSRTR